MIKLAVMVEQVTSPRLQDDIKRLFEARPAFPQGNAEREIFSRDAAHEAGDLRLDPATRGLVVTAPGDPPRSLGEVGRARTRERKVCIS